MTQREIEKFSKTHSIGTRVQICGGSGCDSGRIGTVVPMVHYTKCHGHYQQPDPNEYRTIKFDEPTLYETNNGYEPLQHFHCYRLNLI